MVLYGKGIFKGCFLGVDDCEELQQSGRVSVIFTQISKVYLKNIRSSLDDLYAKKPSPAEASNTPEFV
jgi:hypothetical protein